MSFLGLLIAAAAAAITADVAYETTDSVTFRAVHRSFTVSTGWAAIVAVLVGAVGMLGLVMFVSGLARMRRRRAVVVEHRRSAAEAQTERDRMAGELERERTARMDAERRASGEPAAAETAAGDGRVSGPARSEFDMTPDRERTEA